MLHKHVQEPLKCIHSSSRPLRSHFCSGHEVYKRKCLHAPSMKLFQNNVVVYYLRHLCWRRGVMPWVRTLSNLFVPLMIITCILTSIQSINRFWMITSHKYDQTKTNLSTKSNFKRMFVTARAFQLEVLVHTMWKENSYFRKLFILE